MEFYFILVEPAVPGNIGAAARAIKTMGFEYLRLIKPCSYMNAEALKMAHGSADILKNANVYSSLYEATGDVDLIVGTTAKSRSARVDYISCSDLPGIIRDKGSTCNAIGILFGREESGLTNTELKECDIVTRIPMISDYPSLNLSQAVMVYAYILSDFIIKEDKAEQKDRNENGLNALRSKTETALTELGIKDNPALYGRIMERLALLGEDDIHLLHSVINKFKEKYRM